jgi:hypothetical protein
MVTYYDGFEVEFCFCPFAIQSPPLQWFVGLTSLTSGGNPSTTAILNVYGLYWNGSTIVLRRNGASGTAQDSIPANLSNVFTTTTASGNNEMLFRLTSSKATGTITSELRNVTQGTTTGTTTHSTSLPVVGVNGLAPILQLFKSTAVTEMAYRYVKSKVLD